MDMYQKRKLRQENRIKNADNEKVTKPEINWYPGHMARAKREIAESVSKVDVVIELVDARCPEASRNPILNEIIGQKPRIIVLNKSDLADEKANKEWLTKFKTKNQLAICADCVKGVGVKEIVKAAYELMAEKLQRQEDKGRIGGSIKAMIVGIPNVGKSTFINRVAGRISAQTGNKPGVTKRNQWVRLDERLQLLDTPGVLWPKLDNQKYASHLAMIGTINDDILDSEEIAVKLIETLLVDYQSMLFERYKIEENFEYNMISDIMDEIGKKRGCLVKGGEVDYTKVANIVIEDFRSGKICRISL